MLRVRVFLKHSFRINCLFRTFHEVFDVKYIYLYTYTNIIYAILLNGCNQPCNFVVNMKTAIKYVKQLYREWVLFLGVLFMTNILGIVPFFWFHHGWGNREIYKTQVFFTNLRCVAFCDISLCVNKKWRKVSICNYNVNDLIQRGIGRNRNRCRWEHVIHNWYQVPCFY